MGKNSKISWTHHTYSPWWGCSNVSPGCVNCYAHTWAKRTGFDLWGAKGQRRTFPEKHWQEPLAWNAVAQRAGERRRVFCASMADVFEDHPALPPERAKLWPLIEATPNLDWLLLTKRIENVSGMVPWAEHWPENVWLGTSVENQEWADKRIPILLELPAIVRFLSCEPLIGSVDLGPYLGPVGPSWTICGGESGHGARRMDPEWARSLLTQCVAASTPFLMKQTGAVLAREWGLKDAKGEDVTEWPLDLQVRQWPDPLGAAQGKLL